MSHLANSPILLHLLIMVVALARYRDIVDAPDFGDLDYESVDPAATKPTKGVIRVNDLLETITGGHGKVNLLIFCP